MARFLPSVTTFRTSVPAGSEGGSSTSRLEHAPHDDREGAVPLSQEKRRAILEHSRRREAKLDRLRDENREGALYRKISGGRRF